MEGIAVEYFTNSIDTGNNGKISEFNSYISDDKEQDACDSHAHMLYIFKYIFESVILVSGMSTAWKDTDGCTKKYRCAFAAYLMAVLSS